MAKFQDKTGQEWQVEITHGHLRALKDPTDGPAIDLRDALKEKGNSVADALGDPERFGRLLWVLCGEQATALGLDPEAFAYRFNGRAGRDATEAFWEATWDFFHGSKPARKAKEVFRLESARLEAAAELMWDKAADFLTSGSGAGSSPAPPASPTPGPEPSAS